MIFHEHLMRRIISAETLCIHEQNEISTKTFMVHLRVLHCYQAPLMSSPSKFCRSHLAQQLDTPILTRHQLHRNSFRWTLSDISTA